jgi:hypothetical protein
MTVLQLQRTDVPLALAKAQDNKHARGFLTPDMLPTSLANGSLLLAAFAVKLAGMFPCTAWQGHVGTA